MLDVHFSLSLNLMRRDWVWEEWLSRQMELDLDGIDTEDPWQCLPQKQSWYSTKSWQ